MRIWKNSCDITVKEEPYMNNMSRFTVYQGEERLGSYYPLHLADMNWLVEQLDGGACPVCDGWDIKLTDRCTFKKGEESPFLETWQAGE